eukprot:jgi/Mesvir1/23864/Mv10660-RA.1
MEAGKALENERQLPPVTRCAAPLAGQARFLGAPLLPRLKPALLSAGSSNCGSARPQLVVRAEGSDSKSPMDSLGNVWVERGAMLAFLSIFAVELSTGEGVLQKAGLTTPLPGVATALTIPVLGLIAYNLYKIFVVGYESKRPE